MSENKPEHECLIVRCKNTEDKQISKAVTGEKQIINKRMRRNGTECVSSAAIENKVILLKC